MAKWADLVVAGPFNAGIVPCMRNPYTDFSTDRACGGFFAILSHFTAPSVLAMK